MRKKILIGLGLMVAGAAALAANHQYEQLIRSRNDIYAEGFAEGARIGRSYVYYCGPTDDRKGYECWRKVMVKQCWFPTDKAFKAGKDRDVYTSEQIKGAKCTDAEPE